MSYFGRGETAELLSQIDDQLRAKKQAKIDAGKEEETVWKNADDSASPFDEIVKLLAS